MDSVTKIWESKLLRIESLIDTTYEFMSKINQKALYDNYKK